MKFLNAIGFLTIIRIPEKYYLKKEDFPGMLVYFPAAGFIIGLICAAFFAVLNFFLPLIIAVIFTCGFEIILTGGIHIDGLADTFDGVFSGERDKDKIRQIMKKGDVGVFGLLAIIFALALKITLIYYICRLAGLGSGYSVFVKEFPVSLESFISGLKQAIPGFSVFLSMSVFAPVFGRLSMVGLFSQHNPSAKIVSSAKEHNTGTKTPPASLATAFFDRSNLEIYALSFFYLVIIFISASIFSQLYYLGHSSSRFFINSIGPGIAAAVISAKALAAAGLSMFFSRGIGRFFSKKTGGLSGDILGAVCVLTEALFILLGYLSLRFL
jgi:cobalamin synthase